MDPDAMLVTGMGLVVLSLPSIIAAWVDSRAPRVGAILLLGGGVLIYWAFRNKTGGYRWSEIPDVLYGVIGQVLN